MTLKVAYFQPSILAIDEVPPVEFSKLFTLSEDLHGHPELNDEGNPNISIRGGQQIQVYPNQLNLDVTWLVEWLQTLCVGYMKLVGDQSGTEDLKYCKPVVTSIWTIRQYPGQYQEMHSHPGGNLSGNIYISVPELEEGSNKSDAQILFRLPFTKDIGKFIMNDTWTYTPKAGTMIMFPSHLPHTVYPWNGLGHRTVVAFDAILMPNEEMMNGNT
jgi:hypothetical protein